jgi:ADP-heptose:LPS heptosyltransferase
MTSIGEIPGGCNRLKHLLYPFHGSYPLKLWSKYRWWKNGNLKRKLSFLNKSKSWLTVIDRLGAPGDALITANVIRCIKNRYSHLKINCITPHPELIRFDPSIDSINCKESFYSFDSSYWELIARKEKKENIISHNLGRIGIDDHEYRAKFYLSEEERKWAKQLMEVFPKPVIAICTRSKESVKNWPLDHWVELIDSISPDSSIIQLGDDKEPVLENVARFAGKHTMRESAALLSQANFFIGPDSLLMHIAKGLGIKSIIIFGGSRPTDCFGYEENINLATAPECSPCWIHDGHETCEHKIKCMKNINQAQVLDAVHLLSSTKTNQSN